MKERTGQKKKVSFGIMAKIMLIGFIPLLTLAVSLAAFSAKTIRKGMRDEAIKRLEDVSVGLQPDPLAAGAHVSHVRPHRRGAGTGHEAAERSEIAQAETAQGGLRLFVLTVLPASLTGRAGAHRPSPACRGSAWPGRRGGEWTAGRLPAASPPPRRPAPGPRR